MKKFFCLLSVAALVLAVMVFTGCASTSGGGAPGYLTITGIPAEFEGFAVSTPVYSMLTSRYMNLNAGDEAAYKSVIIRHDFADGCVWLPNNDYKGKLVSFPVYSVIDALANNKRASVGVAIEGGEVTLPLYEWKGMLIVINRDILQGYTGSDTRDVQLNIRLTEDIPATKYFKPLLELARVDATFSSVKFENGVATVKWNERR
jgi:hypothetical protein